MPTAAAVLVALGVASSAAGYWSGPGSGSISETDGTIQTISVSPGTASGQLYPGAAEDVALSFSNPNPFAVQVGSVSLDTSTGTGGFVLDTSHASCNVSALAFTNQTNGGAGWSVPSRVGSRNGSLALDLPGALTMSSGATNACQGAIFTFYLTVSP